jgi:hypothetical protein
MPEQDKPPACLHCAIVEAINRHAAAYCEGAEHSGADILMALSQITTDVLRRILRDIGEGEPPAEGSRH